jgi:hypothetical protein
MRDARMAVAALTAAALTGCSGGGSLPAQAIKITPEAGTESVTECLAQEVQKMGYKVLRVNRGAGFLEAERRDDAPDISRINEYAGGDRIVVTQLAREGQVRPLAITPSSFVMEWLFNGANRKARDTSERALADAQALSDRCRL